MDVDELSDLKYAELQAIAKKHGLRANGGKEHLAQQLATYFEDQAAPSTSRTTRSTSQSFKRRLVDHELSTEDEAVDAKVPGTDVPASRRTRSGHHSGRTPSINNTPAGSVRRTRSRIVSSVAPRAALIRTTSQSRLKQFDSGTEQESSTANATPPPPILSRRKALDSQRRLGVGRPRAIGGSGVRKSTARAKSASVKPSSSGRIVEVVVPTLQAVREEEAAAASRASPVKPPLAESLEQEEEEEDERTSTPPPPPLRTKPPAGTSPPGVHDTTVRALLSTLESRIEKTESALETERRRVASLSARVARLEAENRRLRDDMDVIHQQTESGAEKQVVSETPQTPSSREPTPPPLANDDEIVEASPSHAHQALAAQLPTSPDSPARPAETDFYKVLRPPPSSDSRSQSPILPKTITPAGAKALSNLLKTLETPAAGQSTNRSSQPLVRPQSSTPARKTLGKHPREAPASSEGADENGHTGASAVNHGPNKRRRVDAEQQAEADDQDVDMDGEPVNMDAEGATENASAALLSARLIASTRASSQPLRSAKGGRPSSRTSVEPDSSRGTRRRTRAGSAAPTLSGPRGRASVAVRELETVAEGDLVANAAGPSSSPQHHLSLAPIDPLPLPRAQDASLPPFVTYPLPGDPVKQLKPLTHFDSGTEFFGTQSKRNYRTDWHEGTVFDDPFDAETVRRAQGIAAEEVQGGFGPQGFDGIADELEERDEQESLGVRGMISFAGEGDAGIDVSGGL